MSDRSGKAFDEGHNTDVWVIDAAGGALTKISDHEEADNSPRWSPDGRTIAFLSAVPEKSHPRIWLAPSTGGAPSKTAADNVDLIPTALRWADGGRALYFEAGVKGTTELYRVDVASRRASPVSSGERTLHLVDINEKTQRMAYGVNDPTRLDDLYVVVRPNLEAPFINWMRSQPGVGRVFDSRMWGIYEMPYIGIGPRTRGKSIR